ncbi:MAG: GIY-YIG nuclease family protein [Rhodoferax sp.]|nr:GIY-YIG nuclease family protein [Rhodoferax sp.]
MRFLDFIALQYPAMRPELAKVHLASWNGEDNPLDVYLAGDFVEWQNWQSRKNFPRPFVISLIALPGDHWLFAGLYRSPADGPTWKDNHYEYQLEEVPEASEFSGRAIAGFARPGRQSYLNAENWREQISLAELRPEKLRIADFPGYRAVNLTFSELSMIVRQSIASWKSALSNAAGVYLISDTATGKLYVGCATGEGGIWQRWSSYVDSGHGGNAELRALLGTSADHALAFRFSILETADLQGTAEDVLRREKHWKSVLLSRDHGLNSN